MFHRLSQPSLHLPSSVRLKSSESGVVTSVGCREAAAALAAGGGGGGGGAGVAAAVEPSSVRPIWRSSQVASLS